MLMLHDIVRVSVSKPATFDVLSLLFVGFPIHRFAYVFKACGYGALSDQSVHALLLDDGRDSFLWQIAPSLPDGLANRSDRQAT